MNKHIDNRLGRLEAALVTAAYIVIKHGPQYSPLLERLEKEVAELKMREDPMAKAHRLLEAYTIDTNIWDSKHYLIPTSA